VRRLVPIPLLLLALFVAACGGSSGSDETAWQEEVEAVMTHFEMDVVEPMGKEIAAASDQPSVEAVYAKFAANAKKFGEEVKATEAPDECVSTREGAVEMAKETTGFAEEMANQSSLSFTEYGALLEKEGTKLAADLSQVEELTEANC
jgi:hypothetical protein